MSSFTPHFFCVPCSSIRGNVSSEMVCKSTYLYDRVNKYTAKYLLIMEGQIKSKRLCRSTFCERDMLSNCVKLKPGAWWLVIFFTSRVRDLNKSKSKLEIIMEKRMHDTWQRKCGLYSLQKSIRRDEYFCNSFESLLNITTLLVRLAQTITKIYRNKIL